MFLEKDNPPFTVEQLMAKIKEEIAKQQSKNTEVKPPSSFAIIPNISHPVHPNLSGKRLATVANWDTCGIEANRDYISGFLATAESRSQVRNQLPDKYNRFPWILLKPLQWLILKVFNILFRDQREVNSNLITALRESLSLNQQLVEQIKTLRSQSNDDLEHLTHVLKDLLNSIQAIDDNTKNQNDHLHNLEKALTTINTQLQKGGQSIAMTNEQVQKLERDLSTTNTHVNEKIQSIKEDLSQNLESIHQQVQFFEKRVKESDERNFQDCNYLKNDLIQQKRLMGMFLEEAQKRLPENINTEQLQTFVQEKANQRDAFYVAFEDRFRGSREDIRNRFKIYLPLLQSAKVREMDAPILDLGCGRGEWLELLRESGYQAKGVDSNQVMIGQCQARGLEVFEANALSYLKSVPDLSLSVVTGFHLIEHLPFEQLLTLLDETMRVLCPGGMIIFETPNPRNILVGSGDFYRDPTHNNPIHPDTISYIASLEGFVQAESYFFREQQGQLELVAASEIKFDDLNSYVTVSRDFALVGYKLYKP